MEKRDYLNLGCGSKTQPEFYNCDFVATTPDVVACDLKNGIPFPDNSFSVVYLSQVIEHFTLQEARQLLTEILRVLKPGGIVRLATPDLQRVVQDYVQAAHTFRENPTQENFEKYEWIILELIDQSVRNKTGGGMLEFLSRKKLESESWVIDRVGYIARQIRTQTHLTHATFSFFEKLKHKIKRLNLRAMLRKIVLSKQERAWLEIGKFRTGGEIHYWLYDEFYLSKLLRELNFVDAKRHTPFTSDIDNWAHYELDVKDQKAYDPSSLFLEARKAH